MPKQLSETVPNMPVVLLVGPAKSGKTTFICRMKWPGKKTYILDVDKNLLGPKKVFAQEKLDFSHIIYDHIDVDDDDKPIPKLMQFLRLGTLLDRAKDNDSIGVIGIASTTSLVEAIMNEVRRQLSKKETDEFKGFDMWGKFAMLWQHLMAACRVMGKPTFFDGHVQAEKGEMDQMLHWALAIPGSTGDLLPSKVTDVWRMRVEQYVKDQKTHDRFLVETFQNAANPNFGATLDVPRQFEATQEWADRIIQQILPR